MGLPASLFAAVGGYLFTYYNTRISKEREAQIERINEQVRYLYGPLLAAVTASKSAFLAMIRQHSPHISVQEFVKHARENPEGPEGKAYRVWMMEVLQPLIEKAAAAVVEHADLLEDSEMEPLLLQLVAHVSAYRVILKKWKDGDIGEWSALSYPNELLQHVEEEYRKIKDRQTQLLGIKQNGIRSKL